MAKNDVYRIYLHRFHGMIFRNISIVSSSSSHEIVVEDAAGLDYIDKVAKRAVEIIFHAEWEKSVLKSHELLVYST